MNNMEIKMAKMEKDIEYIKEELNKGTDNFKELFDKIDTLPERFDGKYASKLTEKIVYSLVGVILLAVASKLANMW